jgi:hypothetical protein
MIRAIRTRVASSLQMDAGACVCNTGFQGNGLTCASIPDAGQPLQPPRGLSYSANPAVFMRGELITTDAPSSSGGPITSWSVAPTLPAGLTLDAETGVVSGIPTVVSPATDYSVTGSNPAGSAAVTLKITVLDVPPAGLVYAQNPATYTLGQPIAANAPTTAGGAVVSWSLAPALPAGLSFDTTTGAITGTPAALSPTVGYAVTATNSGGSTTAALTIAVVDVPPTNLAYSSNPVICTKGVPLTAHAPTVAGGAVVTWSVTPVLPAGLTVDAATGILSGTASILSPAAQYVVTATNSGGSTSVNLQITVNDLPPAALSYPSTVVVGTIGQPIAADAPTAGGGAVVAWAISPSLPQGLAFDTVTGTISGTPTAVSSAMSYAVTATNSGGLGRTTLTITVNDVPPGNLGYATNPLVGTVNVPVAADSVSNSGGAVVSWGIAPALPQGLQLDSRSGAVSGTPAAVSPSSSYTLTATNSGGSATTTLTVTVNDAPPAGLTYATSAATYKKGVPITPNLPTISGGAAVSWSISPPLPAGLRFDATTGVISGTPSTVSGTRSETITASNSGGSASTTIQMTVNDVAPMGLSYATNPVVFTKGMASPADVPSSSGGTVVSWSVNPALPSGLQLDPFTGVVSGTPTALAPARGYVVTATDSGGSATVALTLGVVDALPAGLSYATNPALLTKGVAISDAPASSGGGAVVAWSISPPLPAGLSFDASTGIVSGAPSALSVLTPYTVMASNTGGVASVTLQLAVNDKAPADITYAPNPVTYTRGDSIAANFPTTSGGPAVAWTITPALPAGLTIDPTTGQISGTPAVVSGTTVYTVTASNSGGSTSGTLTLTVDDVPPASLTYAENPAVYTINVPIAVNSPIDSTNVTLYSISPALPVGLSFDAITGAITGTPSVLTPASQYTVTAANSGGSVQATVNIAVIDVPPTNLLYGASPVVYTKGVAIAPDVPTAGGGPVVSWSSALPLPAGLTLDPATGVLTGTPTVVAATTTYIVTATNSGGSVNGLLTITVNDVAPRGVAYPANPAVFTKGVRISSDVPSSAGGRVTSWSITPVLPAGLQFSTVNGMISGVPTALSPATGYSVTAQNSGGTQTVGLTITVVDVAPAGLAYPTNPIVATVGERLDDDTPAISGGPVISWTVTPPLPAGLHLSVSDGTISGTPSVLAAPMLYTVAASNSGGQATAQLTIAINDVAPFALSYTPNSQVFTKGAPIAPATPAVSGGAITAWSVQPALPSGLSLDSTTGMLSGTPAVVSPQTGYTVTAANSGGSTTTTLTLTVQDVAPSGLSYSRTPVVYTRGVPIADDTPTTTGGGPVTSWSVSPALPAGLSISATTGILFGTPTVLSTTPVPYTITATNSGGSTTATVTITVNDQAPSGLSYTTNPAVYTQGMVIAGNVPTLSGGGPATSWSITPALPMGLGIDATTGDISGTPTVLSTTPVPYTVTATNSGGATTAMLTITVNDQAPSGLSYGTNPATFTRGVPIISDLPSQTAGGAATSWAIAPPLPSGLSFSTTTGTITGTPSVLSQATSYTVTASNSGGARTVSLQLTVNDQKPAGLSYATTPAVYTKGVPIPDNTPTTTGGGAVTSWSVSPSLPAGLSISATSGILSGTPTVLSITPVPYTITATNSGGSTTATVTITVNDQVPSGLSYPTNPAVYTQGVMIAANAPTLSGGGPATSWSITPALPMGLDIDVTTGVISGTPTVLSTTPVPYTVTATNSGGSTTATLTISVNDQAPSGLSYATNPATFTRGVPISSDLPSQTAGGPATSWTIAPPLPSGLSFSTTTGAVSGTPTVLSSATSYTVTATNSGGSGTVSLQVTVNDQKPAGLSYTTTPAVYTKGVPIADNAPATTGGGPVTGWSVSPSLPAGLSISATSGILSGTPTVLSTTPVPYTITATNSGGSTTATVTITVNDQVPSGLSYPTNPAVYTRGVMIAVDAPTLSGGGPATSWSITPALPLGLGIDATTGDISGTPTVLSTTPVPYTVTATNSGGSTTATLTISVNDQAPSGLSYATNPATFTRGVPTTSDLPSQTAGGPATSWTIAPALPSGLSFSTTTGAVSGTPSVLSSTTSYTVTATNSGGSGTVSLQVTVNDQKPTGLSYATTPAVYTKGVPIADNTPTTTGGGAVTNWSVSPALPAGLSISATTGILSGTPTILSTTPVPYTITATNSGGSTTATVTITVNDQAPSGLSYGTNPAVYTDGVAIAVNAPTLSGGGPATSWSVTPALPLGLGIDATTGDISGTPTVLSTTPVPYTVTATNSGGSTTATLTITVNDQAPSGLSYATNPATFTRGIPITSDLPSQTTGGPATSWTIAPPLPSGLSFSTTTGAVSGTPTVLSSTTSYTVTATNSGGSGTVSLQVTVNDQKPVGLSYTTTPAVYTKGVPIADNAPATTGGGPITGWSVSPSLPAGLSISATSGILSGTPTVLSITPVPYTITASNSGGSTTATVTITVDDQAPSGLSYGTNPAVYTDGVAIAVNAPTLSGGGPATSWSVTPALPLGLGIDATTGDISGTPTVLSTTPVPYTVTATNSGGSTTATLTITVNDQAPSGLSYATNPATFTRGIPITSDLPSQTTGGPATSWAIAPPLPNGLSFSTTTGAVSGTPSVLSLATSYTVTATNSGGSGTVSLQVTVNDQKPTGLSYATTPAVYTKGVPIADNTPTTTGGGPVTAWSVSPNLPAGLSLSATTGIIFGTPTSLAVLPQGYTVTAGNSGGATTTTVTLSVVDQKPVGLSYSVNPIVSTEDATLSDDVPTLEGGGPVISWSISPALPSGLDFDLSSGIISGTPVALLTTPTQYTITAENSGGSTTVTLTLSVDDAAPSGLSYSVNPAVFMKNVPITNDVPSTSGGGAPTSYAISPQLPAGLSFSTITGAISGTPTAVANAAGYTVMALNSGGKAETTLTITVNDTAPGGLSYSTMPAVYTKGVIVANDAPSLSGGGAATAWSISPGLPAGLNFSGTTGIISGTPSVISATTAYTITASNSGGSTTVTFNITVNDLAPSGLSYAVSPASYTKSKTITDNAPTLSGGGPATLWTIAPSLPTGLGISTTTGIISGTPSVLSAVPVVYTVTAANSGGSTTANITITVNDVAPSGIVYPVPVATYPLGQTISTNTPTVDGGPLVSWTVSPALPGLTLNPATGAISGHPTIVTGPTSYTVTASNSGGSASTTLLITVSATNGIIGAVAAGASQTCAIVGGGAECWGQGNEGQLGDNSLANSWVPVQVSNLTSGVQALSSGQDHTCAIVNGGAQCWGYDNWGQLGQGVGAGYSAVPVQVTGLTSGVQALAAGVQFTCAVVNGSAQCWGYNDFGQLGNNSTNFSFSPVQVSGLSTGVEQIATGQVSSCAVVNGGVFCWGYGHNGALGNNSTAQSDVPVAVSGLNGVGLLSGVQAIGAGQSNFCVVANGAAACWGDNASGDLGNNSAGQSNVPVQVSGLSGGVEAIAPGSGFACAVANGGVSCWGTNSVGELGQVHSPSSIPVALASLAAGAQTVKAGAGQACALVNGGVECWGENTFGQVGNNSLTSAYAPAQVVGLAAGVAATEAGATHTCTIVNGGVECWGDNTTGALGNNSTLSTSSPVQVAGLSAGVQSVALGSGYTCAVVNGGARCWGVNANGTLGDNTTSLSTTPAQVSGLTGGVQRIAAGLAHACAEVNGAVQCWGDNVSGDLGNNSTAQSVLPVTVTGLSGVQSLAAGDAHTCAIAGGALECWGSNASGQLGNNSTTDSWVPVTVQGISSGAQAVALGSQHTCAIVNGAVECWGSNAFGQLGTNVGAGSSVPVTVIASGAQAIAAGSSHTCAIVAGGLRCWGDNSNGQLGDNTNANVSVPTAVLGLTAGVQSLTAGGAHTCVLVGGVEQCWGAALNGELGDNNATTDEWVPTAVVPWAL